MCVLLWGTPHRLHRTKQGGRNEGFHASKSENSEEIEKTRKLTETNSR